MQTVVTDSPSVQAQHDGPDGMPNSERDTTTKTTKPMQAKKQLPNYCYILKNDKDDATYVGYTNNPEKRIRQHNGEIAGGARFTCARVRKRGCKWTFLAIITFDTPLFNNKVALSYEWHLKFLARCKRSYRSHVGRRASIEKVLENSKFTEIRPFLKVYDSLDQLIEEKGSGSENIADMTNGGSEAASDELPPLESASDSE